eukprot:3505095-Rhodomonas_salina.1
MAEFLKRDASAVDAGERHARTTSVGVYIPEDDPEKRNLMASSKNLLRLESNVSNARKKQSVPDVPEVPKCSSTRPKVNLGESMRNLLPTKPSVKEGATLSGWFEKSMKSFRENKEDESRDQITLVRVFPNGTVLADGLNVTGKISIQQALQLLVLSQQSNNEIIIGSKSCPPMVGYRCKASEISAKNKYMHHLTKGSIPHIVLLCIHYAMSDLLCILCFQAGSARSSKWPTTCTRAPSSGIAAAQSTTTRQAMSFPRYLRTLLLCCLRRPLLTHGASRPTSGSLSSGRPHTPGQLLHLFILRASFAMSDADTAYGAFRKVIRLDEPVGPNVGYLSSDARPMQCPVLT